MLFVLDFLLVLCFAIITTSLFKFHSLASSLLAWYLFFVAGVVLVSEIAGFFKLLNYPFFFLALHIIMALISFLFWIYNGSPPLFASINQKLLKHTNWPRLIKTSSGLWSLAAGISLAFLVNAALILLVPQNNNDSMATHLARVGYWLQHGSFEPWATPSIKQIIFPFNAQVQFLWTILFTKGTHFAGFVQWAAALTSMVAIAGIARILGSSRQQALFSALIWGTLPLILLESTTTQNDLVLTALVLIAIYFLYVGLKSSQDRTLVLSGMALGLAIGTKQTVFFILPGLGLFLLTQIKCWQNMLKRIFRWGLYTFASFALLGAYVYTMNFINYANPFGPTDLVNDIVGLQDAHLYNDLILKPARWLYQFADPVGIPPFFAELFVRLKALIAAKLFSVFHIPVESGAGIHLYPKNQFDLHGLPLVQEDEAWFGPLGFFFLLPVIGWQTIIAIKQKSHYKLGLTILAASLVVGIMFLKGNWTPYQGRYMILAVSCTAPLVATVWGNNRIQKIINWLIICIGLLVTATVVLTNYAKPLVGPRAIWKLDYIHLQTMQSGSHREIYRIVTNQVPEDATLGHQLPAGSWEFPYFGKYISRKLVPIYLPSYINNSRWLHNQGIEYVLVNHCAFPDVQTASELTRIARAKCFTLFTWDSKGK